MKISRIPQALEENKSVAIGAVIAVILGVVLTALFDSIGDANTRMEGKIDDVPKALAAQRIELAQQIDVLRLELLVKVDDINRTVDDLRKELSQEISTLRESIMVLDRRVTRVETKVEAFGPPPFSGQIEVKTAASKGGTLEFMPFGRAVSITFPEGWAGDVGIPIFVSPFVPTLSELQQVPIKQFTTLPGWSFEIAWPPIFNALTIDNIPLPEVEVAYTTAELLLSDVQDRPNLAVMWYDVEASNWEFITPVEIVEETQKIKFILASPGRFMVAARP